MKGPRWQQEMAAAGNVIAENGLELERYEEFQLPFSGAERAILIFHRKRRG